MCARWKTTCSASAGLRLLRSNTRVYHQHREAVAGPEILVQDDDTGKHHCLTHGRSSIDGAGVVLGWRFLAAKDIEAGRVVEPFDLALPLGSSFYLVYPEAHSLRPNIAALRDWLVQEVRES
jgi:DNA-binding transcriptional LysR family regulator